MEDFNNLEEIKLNSEEIFDGHVVHLFKDTVRLPNGNTGTRETIRHVGAVAIVPMTDDGKVIVERQFRYPMGQVITEIPAGKLDSKTEDRLSAAKRELEEETGYKLLKRELLDKGANKVLGKIKKWGLGGVSLESLSQIAYSDCSTETTEYMTKGYMAKDVTEIIGKFKENYKVAGEDANAYAAAASDIVFNTPSVSAQERIFKYDIPFYQIVFKGYVPLTCESLNLSSNPKRELLTAVEAGSGLNYTLISKYYNEFIDYHGYLFFGSQYSDIADSIIATSNELADYYKAINGSEIVSHTVLDSGLRETVYANGVKAYVNYTDASIAAPNGDTVESYGYVWEK